tara:strand:- start:1878 stop:2684 length:807 start_codon:yes stop_codon:yes gene_type:complete
MKQHTKSLGQVFLHDKNIIEKIITFAKPQKQNQIIEIGCGNGSLTKALSNLGTPIHVIEIDERWLNEVKNMQLKHTTFEHIDALNVNFYNYPKSNLIANLPYQITTPLIEHFAKYKTQFYSLTIMVQKDVAERLISKKSTKQFGSMTLFCNYHFSIEKGFSVSRNCFSPSPNVDSYVIKLTPIKSFFSTHEEALFFAMTRSFFWGRRKTMLNCLLNSPYLTCDPAIRDNKIICEQLSKRGEALNLNEHQTLFLSVKSFISNKNHFKST